MASANIGSTGIVAEVLTKDNYIDWSVVVKNYLIGKGLWENIVEGNVNRHKENWKLENGQALHAIQLSCSHYCLSQIRNCKTAQEAWNHLKAVFSGDLRAENYHDIEHGFNQPEIELFHAAVRKCSWNDALSFIRNDGDIIFQKSSSKGWTSLHIAVDAGAGHYKIMQELVKKGASLTERDWEGYTPFALAAKSINNVTIIEWMLDKGRDDLLTMKIKSNTDDAGDIPVLLAATKGHKITTRFLFGKTRWFTLLDNNCYYANKLLSHCIRAEIFDVALALLQQRDGIQLSLNYKSDQCMQPIYELVHIPTAFRNGTQLNWFDQIFYNFLEVRINRELGGGKIITLESQDGRASTSIFSSMFLGGNIFMWVNSLASVVSKVTMYSLAIGLRIFQPSKYFYIIKIYYIKEKHCLVDEILRCFCERVEKISFESELHQWSVHDSMLQASKYGIIEFINSMRNTNPDLLYAMDKNKKGIFAHAILNRQEEVFKLIYEIEGQKGLERSLDIISTNLLFLVREMIHVLK